jgi:adenylate cyclase
LFADLAGFTPLASRLTADELVDLLNRVLHRFDALTETQGVKKNSKPLATATWPRADCRKPGPDHAERITRLGLAMLDDLSIRIGINSGPVLAGIIDVKGKGAMTAYVVKGLKG